MILSNVPFSIIQTIKYYIIIARAISLKGKAVTLVEALSPSQIFSVYKASNGHPSQFFANCKPYTIIINLAPSKLYRWWSTILFRRDLAKMCSKESITIKSSSNICILVLGFWDKEATCNEKCFKREQQPVIYHPSNPFSFNLLERTVTKVEGTWSL